LQAGRAGPHELRVRAGDEVSVIPFRVLVLGGASWAMVNDGAFLLAGLLVVGGVLTGRLPRPVVGAASASASASTPMIRSTSRSSPAVRAASSSSADLPMPASPRTTTVPPRPLPASAIILCRKAISAFRPIMMPDLT
jgi:hypothetical protein